jgi:hypothetical protein
VWGRGTDQLEGPVCLLIRFPPKFFTRNNSARFTVRYYELKSASDQMELELSNTLCQALPAPCGLCSPLPASCGHCTYCNCTQAGGSRRLRTAWRSASDRSFPTLSLPSGSRAVCTHVVLLRPGRSLGAEAGSCPSQPRARPTEQVLRVL